MKTISNAPAFLYHGLVIPHDTPSNDTVDTYFSPLPSTFYPPEDHDSSNHGVEYAETEEIHESEPLIETPEPEEIGGASDATGEIRVLQHSSPTTKASKKSKTRLLRKSGLQHLRKNL